VGHSEMGSGRVPAGWAGRSEVLHGRDGGQSEEPDEMEWIPGVFRFVEDAVHAQAGDLQAETAQSLGDGLWVDLRVGVVRGGPCGDQEVGVGGGRPSPVTFGQPAVRRRKVTSSR
jgi:hypothetical protein